MNSEPYPKAYVTCSACHSDNPIDTLTAGEISTIEENLHGEDTITFTCRDCAHEGKAIVRCRR